MDGVINVFKEKDWTSSDVVNKLKGILRERHIGHGGTLDPDAEGVLPVCVGKATRLFDYLTAGKKQYEAVLKLGVITDTQDASGTVLETRSVTVDEQALDAILPRFTGRILQTPPLYSALRKNGKRLYEYARAGEDVELEPRPVEIFSLQRVSNLENGCCRLLVTCGKGTYIRTLCHDIGLALGCGGHMQSLLRTYAAGLPVASARRLSEIQDMMTAGDTSFLIPMEEAVAFLPRVEIAEEAYEKILNGAPVPEAFATGEPSGEGEPVRLFCKHAFIGIGEKAAGAYKVKRMLRERL